MARLPIISKWSGLGMNVCSSNDNDTQDAVFDAQIATLISNSFTNIRIGLIEYTATDAIAVAKAKILRAISAGANVIWGVNSGDTITSTNWPDFSTGVQAAATWAQANGVSEFLIGNEDEYRVDGVTITVAQLISNLKTLATTVQGIFTNGPVNYCTSPDFYADWITAGKGNIDKFGGNQYLCGNDYDPDYHDALFIERLNDLVAAFGTGGTFLSEFEVSYSAVTDFSTDESVQASKTNDLIGYTQLYDLNYGINETIEWIKEKQKQKITL